MKYFLWAVLILGLILIANSFVKQLNFPDASYQLKKGERLEIIPGEILQQRFVANRDGLSQLGLLLGGKSLKKDYYLDIILADENCVKEIRKQTLGGEIEFDSKYLYYFRFDRLANSGDKKYCLKIVYYTKAENPKKKRVRLFENSFYQDDKNGYSGGGNLDEDFLRRKSGYEVIKKDEMAIRKGENGNPIVFRPGYKNETVFADLKELNQRISQYKPWFLKGWYLGAIVVLSFISFGVSIVMLGKKGFDVYDV